MHTWVGREHEGDPREPGLRLSVSLHTSLVVPWGTKVTLLLSARKLRLTQPREFRGW